MRDRDRAEMNRRLFLRRGVCAPAIGGIAVRNMLVETARGEGGGLLAPRPTRFPARAKRLLFIFLTGGFSHIDTFDEKPALRADAGKTVTVARLKRTTTTPLLASPFEFRSFGRSGLRISELFPHLGTVADELCVIRSLHTDIVEHFQAVLAMHTGSATVPMPSLGAWLSFGLGTFNANLPSFVVLAEQMTYAGSQIWDSRFLPPAHQGVRIVPGAEPIPDLHSAARSATLADLENMMLRDWNERHSAARPDDADLKARIQTYETARGMMREAPEVFDFSRESDATLELYGANRGDSRSFAAQCLIARRLLERGVRIVELIDTGSSNNWDSHGNMNDHRPKAKRVDRPITALIRDLKRRGLLDDTLVVCCTEFGRTPWTDDEKSKGRGHHAKAFSSFLAGAGVRGGTAYGETDEHGREIVSNPVHVHDFHATILHLMGIDHRKLTYRYAGRDFRLTDVSGEVQHAILS